MKKVLVAYFSRTGKTEAMVDSGEAMKACQDYGKALGEKLGA